MMTLPTGLAAWLAANNTGHATDLITLTLVDGTVYRWTTWGNSLTTGGNTYLAYGAGTAPLVKRGAYARRSRLAVDTLDLELNGKGWTIGGVVLPLKAAQGYFDGARVQLDRQVMPQPGDVTTFTPVLNYFEGRVASVEPFGSCVRLRCKSELEVLSMRLPKFLAQPSCGNVVYDTNCTLNKATYTDSATATGGTTTTVTTATAAVTGRAANYYVLGVVKFTSGALSGLRRSVKVSSGGTLTLALPLPSAPQAGDTFTVFPGCDRSKATCGAFPAGVGATNNLVHFRGYPHIPSAESGS